jgi:hypothetical protein
LQGCSFLANSECCYFKEKIMWRKQAAQNPDTGKWKFCTFWGSKGGPSGACQGDECQGHDTAEEAYEHERQRLFAEAEECEYSGWHGCKADGCDAPTKKGYRWGQYGFVSLCDKHLSRDELAKHVICGESFGS